MPIQGISSSDAAFSQAGFDQLKEQVQQGTVRRTAELRDFTQSFTPLVPPIRREAGGGGDAVWMNTPESTDALVRQVEASGYAALSLGGAWPPFPYEGHLLNGGFHQLDPMFGGLKADYKL